MRIQPTTCLLALSFISAAALTACGGGSGSTSPSSDGSTPAQPTSVDVPIAISDGASENWGTIGVKLLSLSLTKKDGTQVAV
ncbi:hypothetical protein, partial [Klebsiella pneumoniae]|uniref:hypothetical protein n=1 Tax=Klebsiella pneumoniae TaxID=573 RepID=UPI002730E797